MNSPELSAFRLGDVRGKFPEEIDARFAFKFSQAFARHFDIRKQVAVGRDMRASSIELHGALTDGFLLAGIDVIDLGLCTTELGYFASTKPGIEATIVVTASHNPACDNGFKCVLRNGDAVTFMTGLAGVMELMLQDFRRSTPVKGSLSRIDYHPEYIDFLRSKFPDDKLRSGHLALNGLNGTAATLAGSLAAAFDLPVTWFRQEPGPMPVQGADPATPGLSAEMKTFMSTDDFAVGVAWDGDCDRCVFYDSAGDLVPTYYIVGLLAEHFLQRAGGGTVVFDSKLCWNTLDIIAANNGTGIAAQTGHAFMKKAMHRHNAIYGGELSSHHYFGDFFGCDSGMYAWLKVVEVVNESGFQIADLIQQRRDVICSTPEINLDIRDQDAAFAHIRSRFEPVSVGVDYFDGLAFEFKPGWRFSVRQSKTEPLVRLNFESRGEPQQLLDEAEAVLDQLSSFLANPRSWHQQLFIQ